MISHLKLCRLCGSLLNDDDDVDTEEGTNKSKTCYDMLKKLLNVEVLQNEKLPNKVCENCFHQLDSFSMFKENFFRTQSSFELVLEQKCFNILSTTGTNASQSNEGQLALEMTVTDETKNLPDDDEQNGSASRGSSDCQVVDTIEPTNQNSGSSIQSTASQIVARIQPTNQNSASFSNQYDTAIVNPCSLCMESQPSNKITANLTQTDTNRSTTHTKFIVEMIPIEPNAEELSPVLIDDSDDDYAKQPGCVQEDPLRLSPNIKTEPITDHSQFDMQLPLPQIKVELDEEASFLPQLQTQIYYVDEQIPRIKQEVIEDSPETSNEALLYNQANEPATASSSNARRRGWHEEGTFNCSASTSTSTSSQPVRKFSRKTHGRLQPLPGSYPSFEGQSSTLKLNEEMKIIMEESKNLKVAMTRIPLFWTLEAIGGMRTDENSTEYDREKENELATIRSSFGTRRRGRRSRKPTKKRLERDQEDVDENASKKINCDEERGAPYRFKNSKFSEKTLTKLSVRAKAWWNNPERRMEHSAKMKDFYRRKRLEKDVSESQEETETPCKMDHSSRMKEYWSDPRNRMERTAKIREAKIRRKLERERKRMERSAKIREGFQRRKLEKSSGERQEETETPCKMDHSTRMKAFWSDPRNRMDRSAKIREAFRRRKLEQNGGESQEETETPCKMDHSARMKAYWSDPRNRMERSAKIREAFRRRKLEQNGGESQEETETPCKMDHSSRMKEYWSDPRNRMERAAKIREAWNPERRMEHSAKIKDYHQRRKLERERQESVTNETGSSTPSDELEIEEESDQENEDQNASTKINCDEERLELSAHKKAWLNHPERRMEQSARMRKLHTRKQQIKHKIDHSARMKEYWSDPRNRMERTAKIREAKIRRKLERERKRMERSAKIREAFQRRKLEKNSGESHEETETPCKMDHSARMKAYWSDPRNRMERSAKIREAFRRRKLEKNGGESRRKQQIKHKIEHSARMKEYWSDPRNRMERAAQIREGHQRRKLEKNGLERQSCSDANTGSTSSEGLEIDQKEGDDALLTINYNCGEVKQFSEPMKTPAEIRLERSARWKAYWSDPRKRMEQSARLREFHRRRMQERDFQRRRRLERNDKECRRKQEIKHNIEHSARMKEYWSDPRNRMERAAQIREGHQRRKLEKNGLERQSCSDANTGSQQWPSSEGLEIDQKEGDDALFTINFNCGEAKQFSEHKKTPAEIRLERSARGKAYWSDPRKRMEQSARLREFHRRRMQERDFQRRKRLEQNDKKSQETVVTNETESSPSEESEIKERDKENGDQNTSTKMNCDEERETPYQSKKKKYSRKRMKQSAKLKDLFQKIESRKTNPEYSAIMEAYWNDPTIRMQQPRAKLREMFRWRKEQSKRERVEKLRAYWKRRREEKAAAMARVETTAVNELKSAENEKIDETPSDNTTQLPSTSDSSSNERFIGFYDSSDSKTDTANVSNNFKVNLVQLINQLNEVQSVDQIIYNQSSESTTDNQSSESTTDNQSSESTTDNQSSESTTDNQSSESTTDNQSSELTTNSQLTTITVN